MFMKSQIMLAIKRIAKTVIPPHSEIVEHVSKTKQQVIFCKNLVEFQLILGEVTCQKCKDGKYNIDKQCKDECDIFQPLNSGCKAHEECIRENNENAKCKCLIPEGQVDDSSCKCAEGSFINGNCLNICETSDDCFGGKCVELYGYDYKTCFCPIEQSGFIIEDEKFESKF